MVRKLKLKNKLTVDLPFYKVKPGKTAEVEIIGDDDIHLRGIELGHLVEVGKEVVVSDEPIELMETYTREELEKLSFTKVRKIGYAYGARGRSKKEIISEILRNQ